MAPLCIVQLIQQKEGMQPKGTDKLEKLAHMSLICFNKSKCKVLHLGQVNPRYVYRLGEELLESSTAEKDFRIQVDEKINMSQQHVHVAQKANSMLGRIKKGVASRERKVIIHLLLCSHETPSRLWCPGLGSPAQKIYGAA